MREYEGVFPAIVTPMDSNGDFNEAGDYELEPVLELVCEPV